MSNIYTDTNKIDEFIQDAEGIVMVSLADCEPCEIMWEALHRANGVFQTVSKICFDSKNRDHRRIIRGLKIKKFPSVIYFSDSKEVSRVVGVNPLDSQTEIEDYVRSGLDLG